MPRRIIRPQRKPAIPLGLTVLQLVSVIGIVGFLVFLAQQQIRSAGQAAATSPAPLGEVAQIGLAAAAIFAVPAAIHAQTRFGRHVLLVALTYLNGFLLSHLAGGLPALAAALFALLETALVWFLYRYRANAVYFDALR